MGIGKSKVYVLPDEEGRIIRIDGGYTLNNIKNIENWVLIDEGYGDRYNLCQSNYLPKSLCDERGIPRYKLQGGKAVERTQEEMDADYTPPEDVKTNAELQAENALLRAQIQSLADRGEFIEDCIAEMAMQVYA